MHLIVSLGNDIKNILSINTPEDTLTRFDSDFKKFL